MSMMSAGATGALYNSIESKKKDTLKKYFTERSALSYEKAVFIDLNELSSLLRPFSDASIIDKYPFINKTSEGKYWFSEPQYQRYESDQFNNILILIFIVIAITVLGTIAINS